MGFAGEADQEVESHPYYPVSVVGSSDLDSRITWILPRWFVSESFDTQTLDAICQVPLLESLEFTFLRHLSDVDRLKLPGTTLSKLKSLSLDFLCIHSLYTQNNLADAKSAIAYLIANTPALEHLDVGPSVAPRFGRETALVNVTEALLEAEKRPDYQPSLRSLKPRAIMLSPISVKGFLARLTCLEIPNDRSVDSRFWSAFRASGIHLTTIKVKALSTQLIEYIHDYHALQHFRLDVYEANGEFVEDSTLQRLIRYALPEHRESLTDLRFTPRPNRAVERRAASDRPRTMLWDTPAILKDLQSLARIERLDLVHYGVKAAGERGRSTLVSAQLCLLLRRPAHQLRFTQAANIKAIVSHSSRNRIKTVHLHLIGMDRFHEFLRDPKPVEQRPIENLHGILRCLKEVEVEYQAPGWTDFQLVLCVTAELRTPMEGYPFLLTRFAHKLVRGGESDMFRLAEDVEATEVLNEPGLESSGEVPL